MEIACSKARSVLGQFVRLLILAALTAALPGPAFARASDVQTAWRLLDYISVDYPEAVRDGRVANPTEYAEQKEFAANVSAKIATLPFKPQRAALVAGAARLEVAIAAKASAATIAGEAHGLGRLCWPPTRCRWHPGSPRRSRAARSSTVRTARRVTA